MASTAMMAILQYLAESRNTIQAAIDDPAFCLAIDGMVGVIATVLADGRKLLLAGNGGSAADAQHIAGEMLPRFNQDRAPIAALALTTDSSVLTAIANDWAVRATDPGAGDVFIAISTSGRSPNILRAIDAARQKRLVAIGFTGRSGGEMASRCDLCLHAPSDSTPLIQQIHITAGHLRSR
jgi:D-sedoheptulose 7-phosphate isomerase